MRDRLNKSFDQGFSLIELLVALTILLILTAFVISAFTTSLKSVRRESSLADRDADVKRALELMTLEIGQAGVTPEILGITNSVSTSGNPQNQVAVGTTITNITNNQIRLLNGVPANATRGLYPGRPIILGVPESSANSETLKIATVNTSCGTTPCVSTTSNPTKTHNAANNNEYVASPNLPFMFGILNPPPAIGTATKVIPAINGATRLGLFGDILNDGILRYVEYTFTNGRLFRSISPLTSATKAQSYPVLDNVNGVTFTLIYQTGTQIPVAVRVMIDAQSSVPEQNYGGGAPRFKRIIATTEIVPQGTYAAALIFTNGAEIQLRSMMPPCQGSGTGTGFPPCTVWNTTAPWTNSQWDNLFNLARRKYNDTNNSMATENLQ